MNKIVNLKTVVADGAGGSGHAIVMSQMTRADVLRGVKAGVTLENASLLAEK